MKKLSLVSKLGESEPQVGCGITWEHVAGELRLNIPANEGPRRHARNPHDSATRKSLWLGPGQSLRLNLGLHDFAGDRHAYRGPLAATYIAGGIS